LNIIFFLELERRLTMDPPTWRRANAQASFF